MKKISIILLMGVIVTASSCKKYLDINENPNQPTSATPELVLPQALTATASNLNGYNSMGSQLVGYSANAGGYGGFGSSITYNFGASDFAGRWSASYDNLEDYQYIIDQTNGDPQYFAFNAVGRIMKAHGFQLLVDTYNDVPYFEALKGVEYLTPKYDQGAIIYKDLANQLDTAITLLKNSDTVVGLHPLDASDVMFAGDVDKWMQFANTLKLRIVIRGGSKVDFSTENKTFSDVGFLTDDALINPGYVRDNNKQNPKWNTWGYG
ncbi:MAG TPA: SusD/RagB family nutrient-binding outer membrane lipoprotein, partial [Flavitalea sp.]|nr:SusD/RagB family nutrient-binding outer membrane lipoprotein [Flavitalea sp.]